MLQYFITNNEKQKSLGNGFRFEPTDGGAQRQASAQRQTDGVTTTSSVTGGGIAKTIRTKAGTRIDDNFIKDGDKDK